MLNVKRLLTITYIIKAIKIMVLVTCAYLILFKPVKTGAIIGDWVTNFVGTLYNHIEIKK